MQIPIEQLKETPGEPMVFELDASAETLDLLEEGVRFTGQVFVCLTATYHNGSVLLQASLRTKVVLACSRCLQQFLCPLEGWFEEEVQVEEISALDVSDLVREHYFGVFPLKPLCRSSCLGLCVSCGTNQNEQRCDCYETPVDHRLSILKKLLSEQQHEEV